MACGGGGREGREEGDGARLDKVGRGGREEGVGEAKEAGGGERVRVGGRGDDEGAAGGDEGAEDWEGGGEEGVGLGEGDPGDGNEPLERGEGQGKGVGRYQMARGSTSGVDFSRISPRRSSSASSYPRVIEY